MLTKRCYDCCQAKRVELFDFDRKRPDGRSTQCKACRRQRQNRGGYGTCRPRARGRALAELARRDDGGWRRRFQQLRTAHPDWPPGRAFCVATNQYRRAHRDEYRELLASYAGAKPAGHKLVYKISCRAQRLLQLAHPEEYLALYAAERARIGNPVPENEVVVKTAATYPSR